MIYTGEESNLIFFYLKCKKRFTTTSSLPLVLCYECGANLESFVFCTVPQENSKQHFMEEDKDLLPFMEAVELNKEQQKRVLEQCLDVMQGTHSHLFNFLLEGLLPLEAMQYLDLFISCNDRERTASTLKLIVD